MKKKMIRFSSLVCLALVILVFFRICNLKEMHIKKDIHEFSETDIKADLKPDINEEVETDIKPDVNEAVETESQIDANANIESAAKTDVKENMEADIDSVIANSTDKNTDLDIDGSWSITQYGPRDINMSFYTIYHPEKGLIVVDGGWAEEASYVREVIGSLGGHVDAWFLTHPHEDHIGAFNVIYPELSDITISAIYTVAMATPEECLSVAPWDNVDAYNNFLALNISDIKYVYPEDIIQIKDLEFEILSTYDENIAGISTDYINDGSMMFKVNGETESFLFCADVGADVSDYLLQKYGTEKLVSDYIQMGHHGYGGLNDDFYEAVNPEVAFFDAPNWLMFDETGKYDNPENAALMENMGSKVVSFHSSPNSIVLK